LFAINTNPDLLAILSIFTAPAVIIISMLNMLVLHV